jgi:hypothetical protein
VLPFVHGAHCAPPRPHCVSVVLNRQVVVPTQQPKQLEA